MPTRRFCVPSQQRRRHKTFGFEVILILDNARAVAYAVSMNRLDEETPPTSSSASPSGFCLPRIHLRDRSRIRRQRSGRQMWERCWVHALTDGYHVRPVPVKPVVIEKTPLPEMGSVAIRQTLAQ